MPVANNVTIHETAKIFQPDLVNIYGCEIGAESTVGPFVEIQKNVVIGARCKISSHSFLCEGVHLEDGVFIGHGVMFTNDRFPAAVNEDGSLKGPDDWVLEKTDIKTGAAIGSGAVILPGITIGKHALIGAGCVVIENIPDYAVVVGNPGKIVQIRKQKMEAS